MKDTGILLTIWKETGLTRFYILLNLIPLGRELALCKDVCGRAGDAESQSMCNIKPSLLSLPL